MWRPHALHSVELAKDIPIEQYPWYQKSNKSRRPRKAFEFNWALGMTTTSHWELWSASDNIRLLSQAREAARSLIRSSAEQIYIPIRRNHHNIINKYYTYLNQAADGTAECYRHINSHPFRLSNMHVARLPMCSTLCTSLQLLCVCVRCAQARRRLTAE